MIRPMHEEMARPLFDLDAAAQSNRVHVDAHNRAQLVIQFHPYEAARPVFYNGHLRYKLTRTKGQPVAARALTDAEADALSNIGQKLLDIRTAARNAAEYRPTYGKNGKVVSYVRLNQYRDTLTEYEPDADASEPTPEDVDRETAAAYVDADAVIAAMIAHRDDAPAHLDPTEPTPAARALTVRPLYRTAADGSLWILPTAEQARELDPDPEKQDRRKFYPITADALPAYRARVGEIFARRTRARGKTPNYTAQPAPASPHNGPYTPAPARLRRPNLYPTATAARVASLARTLTELESKYQRHARGARALAETYRTTASKYARNGANLHTDFAREYSAAITRYRARLDAARRDAQRAQRHAAALETATRTARRDAQRETRRTLRASATARRDAARYTDARPAAHFTPAPYRTPNPTRLHQYPYPAPYGFAHALEYIARRYPDAPTPDAPYITPTPTEPQEYIAPLRADALTFVRIAAAPSATPAHLRDRTRRETTAQRDARRTRATERAARYADADAARLDLRETLNPTITRVRRLRAMIDAAANRIAANATKRHRRALMDLDAKSLPNAADATPAPIAHALTYAHANARAARLETLRAQYAAATLRDDPTAITHTPEDVAAARQAKRFVTSYAYAYAEGIQPHRPDAAAAARLDATLAKLDRVRARYAAAAATLTPAQRAIADALRATATAPQPEPEPPTPTAPAPAAQPIPDAETLTEDQRRRAALALAGVATVANVKTDAALIAWATRRNLYTYAGRPSRYGNPYPMRAETERAAVITQYRAHLANNAPLRADARRTLRGQILGCYCYPRPCHCDALAEIANADA